MQTDELDFELPAELIAQEPSAERAASRLLHYKRTDRSITHRHFSDLPKLLRAGDVLVFNDSKVLPAKFVLTKISGGRVEGLFLSEIASGRWRVLLKNLGNAARLNFIDAPNVQVNVTRKMEGGEYEIQMTPPMSPELLLGRVGRMPLPPYIKRQKEHDQRDEMDRRRYQTVYAHLPGSVAAPTAGLHFTPALLDQLRQIGVEEQFITLHVGMGTFKPVATDTLESHAMHSENYSISASTADALNRAKKENRRIIAVGTTAARVLESQLADGFIAKSASTEIFIYPPYEWKNVSALITNFHLPRSTLIALVAALVGLSEQRRIYAEAI
ncbi:MAG TPA: tRNA preQ1(34) S-adenosylmethionine ribosyltransferase-isomerase QueA, partial [Tepidisphaeraceae bacterium]|nr:tRNA preQ1(34) S-adenosylmethionine ribosyltransferase-isomerase QueA [Tepidisphaeraceae bacterium]